MESAILLRKEEEEEEDVRATRRERQTSMRDPSGGCGASAFTVC
jgi:hypothetical protein